MPAPVTSLYAGLLGLLLVVLAANVSRQRGVVKAAVGEVPPELVRHVRAHGNATENVPIVLILLLVLELSGLSPRTLHVFGGTFLGARLIHAAALITKVRVGWIGVTATLIVIVAMSVMAIGRYVG